jgi:hypothetical protein
VGGGVGGVGAPTESARHRPTRARSPDGQTGRPVTRPVLTEPLTAPAKPRAIPKQQLQQFRRFYPPKKVAAGCLPPLRTAFITPFRMGQNDNLPKRPSQTENGPKMAGYVLVTHQIPMFLTGRPVTKKRMMMKAVLRVDKHHAATFFGG